MAYMSQDRKKELTPGIKAVLEKYNMKASIGVNHYSTLVVNLRQGPINFINYVNQELIDKYNYKRNIDININEYHLQSQFTGIARDFLVELRAAMMNGNHDNSDPMTDYFDVGWYIDINIGTYEKEYVVI